MAATRARRKGELPALKHCTVCKKVLKPTSVGRAYEQSLCFAHWAETDEGKQYLKDKRAARRGAASTAPQPWRYFGCLPGEAAFPEGPFNRIRLAISSSYAGKGKPRGSLFIVWSDDVVTEHQEVKQADVGSISRSEGVEVDRSDLAQQARLMPALTERVRHYGRTDVYLIDW